MREDESKLKGGTGVSDWDTIISYHYYHYHIIYNVFTAIIIAIIITAASS